MHHNVRLLALSVIVIAQTVSATDIVGRAITSTNTVSALTIASVVTTLAPADTATATLIGTNDYYFPQPTDYMTNFTYTPSLIAASPVATSAPEVDVFTVLADTTNTSQLAASNDGNLYLVQYNTSAQPGVNFLAADSVITADEQGRFFNYYLAEWAAYNVSRLRLNDLTATPNGARMTTLVPLAGDAASDPVLYASVDTAGNVGYLAVCTIYNQVSKVFMVADFNASLALLSSPALQNTIVGGVVNECEPLALTSSTVGF